MVRKETQTRGNKARERDMKRRSTQPWERGRGADRKGNPRYKPVKRRDKNDVLRKLYVLRNK